MKLIHQEKETHISSSLLIHTRKIKGQSIVEFLLSFMFIFLFLIFFINTSIALTNGYLIHYATFLASRIYLVTDTNSNTDSNDDNRAWEAANAVFNGVGVTRFIETPGEFSVNAPGTLENKPYVGIFYEFQQKLSPIGMFGGNTPVDLTSESFLGREPTRNECLTRIHDSFRNLGVSTGDEGDMTYYDNGC